MRKRTDYIVIHCSATPPTSDIGVDEIRDWHVNQRGWSDIGYHCVIRRDGEIEFGRHFDIAGAHVKGQNYRSVGVCMVGGIDSLGKAEDNFTRQQWKSLDAIVEMLRCAYPKAKVVGHRDLSPDENGDGKVTSDEWVKECPSFEVSEHYE